MKYGNTAECFVPEVLSQSRIRDKIAALGGAEMCSNFGLNLHPGRKPAALQWQWYNFTTRTWELLRRRFFPRALYLKAAVSPRAGVSAPPEGERKQG